MLFGIFFHVCLILLVFCEISKCFQQSRIVYLGMGGVRLVHEWPVGPAMDGRVQRDRPGDLDDGRERT